MVRHSGGPLIIRSLAETVRDPTGKPAFEATSAAALDIYGDIGS